MTVASPDPSGSSAVRRRGTVPPRPERLDDLPPRPIVIGAAVLGGLALAAVALAGPGGSDLVGRAGIFAVVLVCGCVVANGWTRVTDLPSRKGTGLVALTGAVSTAVSVLVADTHAALAWLPTALAVSVIAAFVHQLLRTDGRPRVVASLSGSLLALALLASGACWVAVAALSDGRACTVVAGSAMALAAVVEVVLHHVRRQDFMLPASMAVGGATGVACTSFVDLMWGVGLLLGVLAAGVAFSVRALLAPLPQLVARRAQAVSAAASVLAPGSLVFLVARILLR